jgi:hypothetical protein
MMQQHYQIKIVSHLLTYSVKVNDICIATNNSHSGARREILLNQFLLQGTNNVHATLSINPKWEKPAEDQYFKWEIIEYTSEPESFQEKIVNTGHWELGEYTKFPVALDSEFDLKIPYGNWVFNNADVLDTQNFYQESLFDYIKLVHEIVSSKDYEKLKPLLYFKSCDLAAAYYIDIEQRLSDQEKFFKDMLFNRKDAILQPLNLQHLMYHYQANGKILEVLTQKGTSPIRFDFEDGDFCELELFLCHKNNQWILCR